MLYLPTAIAWFRKRASQEISRTHPDTHVADVESPHLLLQTAPAIAARS